MLLLKQVLQDRAVIHSTTSGEIGLSELKLASNLQMPLKMSRISGPVLLCLNSLIVHVI